MVFGQDYLQLYCRAITFALIRTIQKQQLKYAGEKSTPPKI